MIQGSGSSSRRPMEPLSSASFQLCGNRPGAEKPPYVPRCTVPAWLPAVRLAPAEPSGPVDKPWP